MSSSLRASAVLAVVFLLAAGCASRAPAQVKGTANYHERMALPPGAVFEATLEEVSKADAPSEVIAGTRLQAPPGPPIAFEIPYDAARIDARHRYVVRARILVDGELLFTTDRSHLVLTGGQGSDVSLLLRRARASGQTIDEPLENTYWKLTELGGAPVALAERQREPHFTLHRADRRVGGSGGCNGFAGEYELQGEGLTFGRMASTMMACPAGMETETEFLAALQQASRARIEGQQLTLLDAAGSVLARFEAVHFR
jgi:putative lipoprotein